jgi:hypothetical protein
VSGSGPEVWTDKYFCGNRACAEMSSFIASMALLHLKVILTQRTETKQVTFGEFCDVMILLMARTLLTRKNFVARTLLSCNDSMTWILLEQVHGLELLS